MNYMQIKWLRIFVFWVTWHSYCPWCSMVSKDRSVSGDAEKGIFLRLSSCGLTTYSPLWDPISQPLWWVSQVSAQLCFASSIKCCTAVRPPTPQRQTPAPTESPRCLEILHIQKNLLSANDKVLTLWAGRDIWSFYLKSFEKIRMPLQVTLDFSGGDPRCFDEPETYYSFSLRILCKTSWGMLVVFHNVLEKVEIQMSGRRAEYIIADKDTWSNLRGQYFKVGPTG